MEASKPVTGVTINEEEAIISIIGVSDTPGNAGTLFTRLGEEGINVDMIIQNVENEGKNNISFSVHRDDLPKAESITRTVGKSIGAETIQTDDTIAKLSAVGVGMISKPGIAARMFKVLGDNAINIKRITTSEIKISCAIERGQAKDALALLHSEFELDR